MTDIIIIGGLLILFGWIILRLARPKNSHCSKSCSGCPIVHSCDKETLINELKEMIK